MKTNPKNSKQKNAKTEVLVNCNHLLDQSARMWPKDQSLAKRYVKIAFKTAMRHRVHLDPKRFCRKCFVPFISDTLKVRQTRLTKTVLYACRNCSYTRRIPYARSQGKNLKPLQETFSSNRQPGSTDLAPKLP